MGNVISICNQKGGVAKTTTCLNLGYSFALLDKSVLLIDFDVQSNLTVSLGYKNRKTLYDFVNSPVNDISKIIVKTEFTNLWLMPSNNKMLLLKKKFSGIKNTRFILKDYIEKYSFRGCHRKIGIEGQYGIGKSTIIKTLKSTIEKGSNREEYIFVEIYPWFFKEVDKFYSYFFLQIKNDLFEISGIDKLIKNLINQKF